MFRIPELSASNRGLVSGTANPLSRPRPAPFVGAGLEVIRTRLDPRNRASARVCMPRVSKQMKRKQTVLIPQSLLEALAAFEGDPALSKEALGAVGRLPEGQAPAMAEVPQRDLRAGDRALLDALLR